MVRAAHILVGLAIMVAEEPLDTPEMVGREATVVVMPEPAVQGMVGLVHRRVEVELIPTEKAQAVQAAVLEVRAVQAAVPVVVELMVAVAPELFLMILVGVGRELYG